MRIWHNIIFLSGSFVLFGLVILFLIIPSITIIAYAPELSSKNRLVRKNDRGIILTDREGDQFFRLDEGRMATIVPLDNISPYIKEGVVAMEDRTFWSHHGISPRGIIRALFTNMTQGKIVAGGSTITQQLVKNTMLEPHKNFLRKYIEAILALALERNFTKNEILEMYLNTVYFGKGAYGIAEATDRYFGIPPDTLSLGQASVLLGLLTAPSSISQDSERAREQQNIVINTLKDLDEISEEEAKEAIETPVQFVASKPEQNEALAPHFALAAAHKVREILGENHPPVIVTTTLDRKVQELAEKALADHISRIKSQGAGNGAVVVIDPTSGEVLAYAGSFDWFDPEVGKVDMAASPRSPGSAFKPFVYALAFERNIMTPATVLPDKPITYGSAYTPKNYDGRFRGQVLARRALANSLNIPSLAVMEKVTVPSALSFIQSLGFTTIKDEKDLGISLILGTNEVPLVEITNGYGMFANHGIYHQSTTILSITDTSGKSLYEWKRESERVLSEESAFLITSILTDNRSRSELFGRLLDTSVDAAVKTGTSEGFRDSVTVGYTPNLVVGVWVGNNDNAPMQKLTGSLGAAPLWKSLIQQISQWYPPQKFSKPDRIVEERVCTHNGLRVNEATSSAITEYFIGGTAPTGVCFVSQPQPAEEVPEDQSEPPQPAQTTELPQENSEQPTSYALITQS